MFEIRKAPPACPNRQDIWRGEQHIGYYWNDTGNVSVIVPGPQGFQNHIVEFLRSEGLAVATASSAVSLHEVENALNEDVADDYDDDE